MNDFNKYDDNFLDEVSEICRKHNKVIIFKDFKGATHILNSPGHGGGGCKLPTTGTIVFPEDFQKMMNDFTKEELIALKNGIEYFPQSVNIDKKYQEMCDGIIIKLKSMIDNYCEHEWIYNQHEQAHCSKCGKNDN